MYTMLGPKVLICVYIFNFLDWSFSLPSYYDLRRRLETYYYKIPVPAFFLQN